LKSLIAVALLAVSSLASASDVIWRSGKLVMDALESHDEVDKFWAYGYIEGVASRLKQQESICFPDRITQIEVIKRAQRRMLNLSDKSLAEYDASTSLAFVLRAEFPCKK